MNYDSSIVGSAYSDTLTDQQEQIRKRHQAVLSEIKSKDPEGANNVRANPDKVTKPAAVAQSQANGIQQFYKPIFKWEKDIKDQSFHIIPTEKSVTYRSDYHVESTSNHLLSLLGYKIDVSHQVEQFKQKLQKFFIESKSHNRLIGKFSELKFGVISSLLSLLGIEPTDIEKLKKDALKKAIEDNINNFEQNEYNLELLTIFKKDKTDSGRTKVLTELRKQLIKQMKLYGEPDFYSKTKIYSIKQEQVSKILGDLLEEKQNLSYIRNFQ
ncbi:MAG: hypothetical protein ACON35_04285 [Candidatus Marinamargulisbacteria bacterium]